MTTTQDTDVVEIHLVGVPLELLAREQERSDELAREFTYVAASDSDEAPARLLALSQHLQGRYGRYMQAVEPEITAALERGDEFVDISFAVPREVSATASQLWALLDEADEFCRRGELLTLATPRDIVQFRRWYLSQVIDQARGAEPVTWAKYSLPPN